MSTTTIVAVIVPLSAIGMGSRPTGRPRGVRRFVRRPFPFHLPRVWFPMLAATALGRRLAGTRSRRCRLVLLPLSHQRIKGAFHR